MEIIINLILQLPWFIKLLCIAVCIAVLWLGSENVFWGIKRLARKFGISELIIGLTIVSIGSSLPEIFVNISAGTRGADAVGVGNIVGSCFVQISLILGICVLVAGQMQSHHRKNLKRDSLMVIGSIIALFLLGLDGNIAVGEALLLIMVYVFYIYYLLIANRTKWEVRKSESNSWGNIVAFLGGGFIVWISAEILISVGIHMGESAGVPQGVIGLFSGIGTSIPELSISLIALLRKSHGISLGNLLGSNITDPLLSLGIGAILAGGYQVSNFLLFTAIPVWFVASFSAMMAFWIFGKMTRIPAMILVVFYVSSFFWFLI